MTDVMQKIQHLNIEVPLIKRFTFNMDNLTKLSLYELKDYENDMESLKCLFVIRAECDFFIENAN